MTRRVAPAGFTVARPGLAFENSPGELVTIQPPDAGVNVVVTIDAVAGDAERVTTLRGNPDGTGGLTVRGANGASPDNDVDVWIRSSSHVLLSNVTVVDSAGFGVVIATTAGGAVSDHVEVAGSTLARNAMNGLRELDGAADDFHDNAVTANGHDGQPYNGDGILMQGAGTTVAHNTIDDDGDDPTFEHGIYVAYTATGYAIHDNTLDGNAASGIKADGQGAVYANAISNSVRGIVLAENTGAGADVHDNTIAARTRSAGPRG